MLILHRRPGRSIVIANEIKIIILDGTGNIRLGIKAPQSMQILRTELLCHRRSSNKTRNSLIPS